MQRHAKAPGGELGGLFGRVDAVAAGQRHHSTRLRGQHTRDAAHRPGATQHHHTLAFQPTALLLQSGFHAGHHGSGGGVGTAGVGHQRHGKGRHHGLLSAFQHVGGQQCITPADEDGGAGQALGAAREDGVLRQAAHRLQAHLGIGREDLVAGVGGHVDVEGAHLAARGEHVQDVGAFHALMQGGCR